MTINQKEIALERLNNGAYDLSQVHIAVLNGNKQDEERHLRNGGEALSQSIEIAMKFYLSRNLSAKESKFFHPRNSNLHTLINYFWTSDGDEGDYYYSTVDDIEPSVDFEYLRRNKGSLTNQSKHSGPPPKHEVLKQYYIETRKFLLEYIDSTMAIKSPADFLKVDFGNWDLLYTAADRFSQEERNYILVIGSNPTVNGEHLKTLAECKWDLVIDFDYFSKDNGFFFHSYKDDIVAPHQIMAADTTGSSILSKFKESHYHFFANNFSKSGKNAYRDFREWNQKAATNTNSFISSFAKVFSNQKTIVLIIYPDPQYVNSLCQQIDICFGNSATFIFANDEDSKLNHLAQTWNATQVNISIPEIANGIKNFSSNFNFRHEKSNVYELPYLVSSETKDLTGTLTLEEFAKLEEVFEVLHLGLPDEDLPENKYQFLIGEKRIGFYGLKHRFDVERQNFQRKYVRPIEKLIEKGKGKVTLFHDAGFGGSTVARRIAWEIHTEYPTFILKEYRDTLVREQLVAVHAKTRKTSFVIVEIPQSISQDEFDAFYKTISPTRPVVFLIVKRGKPGTQDLAVTDWANDVHDLISAYKPYLNELYSDNIRLKKIKELDAIEHATESFKKTPFYIGLVTFEEKFLAINDYIKNFVQEISGKESQRKVLIYLSLVHDYLGLMLPSTFLRCFLDSIVNPQIFHLENYFANSSSLVESLLSFKYEGKQKYWSIRHAFFAKELKKQLLGDGSLNPEAWKTRLSEYCIAFINDSSNIGENNEHIEDILQKLFIGNRKDRSDEDFTPIITAIPSIEEKEAVFVSLKEAYPSNPHYCSHLARFYAYNNKNSVKALEYANEAIELARLQGLKDPLLHHIKGMVLRSIAYENMEQLIKEKRVFRRPLNQEIFNEIIYNYIPNAEIEFSESREIAKRENKIDGHGYVAHIQMLVRAIDFASIVLDIPRYQIISENREPFGEWIDFAETLLEDVRRMNNDNEDISRINDCNNSIEELYENYEVILQNLNNYLGKSPNPSRTRRQIARTYFRRNPNYFKDKAIVDRILTLLQQNLDNESDNEKNFQLWFKVARHSNITVTATIKKLQKWKAQSTSIDAVFYLSILQVLMAFKGYSEAVAEANKLISECKVRSRSNITVYEWYSKGIELGNIINKREIDDGNKEDLLEFVEGIFTEYTHEGRGYITILDGLQVFVSPTQAKLKSSDLYKTVRFYLGFSYEGLRADSGSVVIVKN